MFLRHVEHLECPQLEKPDHMTPSSQAPNDQHSKWILPTTCRSSGSHPPKKRRRLHWSNGCHLGMVASLKLSLNSMKFINPNSADRGCVVGMKLFCGSLGMKLFCGLRAKHQWTLNHSRRIVPLGTSFRVLIPGSLNSFRDTASWTFSNQHLASTTAFSTDSEVIS